MKTKPVFLVVLTFVILSCQNESHSSDANNNADSVKAVVSTAPQQAKQANVSNPFDNFDIGELHKKLNLNTFHSSLGPRIEDKTKPAYLVDFYPKYTAAGSCDNEISALGIEDPEWHYEIIPTKVYDYNNDGIMDLEVEFIDAATHGTYDSKSQLVISKNADGTYSCIRELNLSAN